MKKIKLSKKSAKKSSALYVGRSKKLGKKNFMAVGVKGKKKAGIKVSPSMKKKMGMM